MKGHDNASKGTSTTEHKISLAFGVSGMPPSIDARDPDPEPCFRPCLPRTTDAPKYPQAPVGVIHSATFAASDSDASSRLAFILISVFVFGRTVLRPPPAVEAERVRLVPCYG